jgi:serine protease Do
MREFYERMFPWFKDMPKEQVRQSLGSGFVVESDGYILTNSHVVSRAEEIIVTFGDGHGNNEKEYEAKLIAADPKTDIALIKIKPDKKLQTVKLGDSNKMQVGQWVIAIGNPFGFAQSVTVGVVSAKGRVIGAGPYDNFIQTDASINPGNSGGPLLNVKGDVIGINTAIYTGGTSQGNIGIGFAIPINAVKAIYKDLKKGKVKRGWLGVMIQRVTKELEKALKLPKAAGALVGDVFKGSPAEKAGIKRGDVIIEFDEKEVSKSDDLPRIVAAVKPGSDVVVKVIREGKETSIKLNLGEMPDEKELMAEANQVENLGMTVENLNHQSAKRLKVDKNAGVVVTSVIQGGPAAKAGFRSGDIIAEVNRKKVKNLDEYSEQIGKVKTGEPILMLVRRGKSTVFLVIKAEAKE